jgi:hypothetical protein
MIIGSVPDLDSSPFHHSAVIDENQPPVPLQGQWRLPLVKKYHFMHKIARRNFFATNSR